MPGTLKVASVHIDRGVLPQTRPSPDDRRSQGKSNGTSSPATKVKHTEMTRGTAKANSGIGDLSSQMGIEALLAGYLKEPLLWDSSLLPSASVKYRAINDEAAAVQSVTPIAGPSRMPALSTSSAQRTDSSNGHGASITSPRTVSQDQTTRDGDLFCGKIPLRFPAGLRRTATGLNNRGNTCYMNSTMQALLHTPPLAHLLLTRDSDQLRGRFGGTVKGFDPVKALQSLTERALSANAKITGGVTTPVEFIKNLRLVARTFHPGRQEDAHEWLRLLLESVQQACLVSAPPSVKQSPLKETTFIQKIFGGRLLSRVTCMSCQHNSDTFDPILDLSLDIRGCDNLSQAMSNFTQVDELRGSEKYRCEKCKRLVVARKQFTLEKCPEVLTVHFKRFTFTGGKLSRPIAFPEKLKVSPSWTSNKQPGPTYTLYAVVHHHGGGPHSGHYVAEVKSPSGTWCEMNDDFVSPQRGGPGGVSSRSAYILFYVKDAKSELEGIVNGEGKKGMTGEGRPSAREPNIVSPIPPSSPSVRNAKSDAAGSLFVSKSPVSNGSPVSRFSAANGPRVNGRSMDESSSSTSHLDGNSPVAKKVHSSGGSSLLSQPVPSSSFHTLRKPYPAGLREDEEEDVGETTILDPVASRLGDGKSQEEEGEDEATRSTSLQTPAPLSKKQRRRLERRERALQSQRQRNSSPPSLSNVEVGTSISKSSLGDKPSASGSPLLAPSKNAAISSPYAHSLGLFRNFSPSSSSKSKGEGDGGKEKKFRKRAILTSLASTDGVRSHSSKASGSSSGSGVHTNTAASTSTADLTGPNSHGENSNGKRSRLLEDDGGGGDGGDGTIPLEHSRSSILTGNPAGVRSFGKSAGRKGWMSGMKRKKS